MKTTRPFRSLSHSPLGKTKTPDEPPPKSRPTPFRERREALTYFLAASLGLAALLGLVALPAHALEHTTGFEVDIRGWTVIKGTSRFNWARQTRGTHSVRIPTNVTADSAHRDRFPALSATGV